MAKFHVYLPLFIFLGFELIAIFAYILATLETRFIASSHIDPHDFPPIVMEHQRGHVSSTVPLGSDKSRYRRPPTRFPPRLGPRACFLAGFLAGNSSGGKTRKREANPGKLDPWKGLLYPGFTECKRRIRQPRYAEILDYLSVTRLKPRKIASALFLESFSCFLHGRNNAASIQFF